MDSLVLCRNHGVEESHIYGSVERRQKTDTLWHKRRYKFIHIPYIQYLTKMSVRNYNREGAVIRGLTNFYLRWRGSKEYFNLWECTLKKKCDNFSKIFSTTIHSFQPQEINGFGDIV